MLVPLPGTEMLAGAKLAVTPLGAPLTDNATADWNPFSTAVNSLIEVEPACATVALVALGVSEKLGGGNNVRLSGCTFVMPPPVAVTVRL